VPAIQYLRSGEAKALAQGGSSSESGSGVRDPSESETRAVSREAGEAGEKERGKRS
jgi:hypothetical protein